MALRGHEGGRIQTLRTTVILLALGKVAGCGFANHATGPMPLGGEIPTGLGVDFAVNTVGATSAGWHALRYSAGRADDRATSDPFANFDRTPSFISTFTGRSPA